MPGVREKVHLLVQCQALSELLPGMQVEVREKEINGMECRYLKLEIFLPETHLDALREALQKVGAGHIGRYDSCLSWSRVTSTWRPLAGTHPYLGEEGRVSCEPEIKAEVTVSADELEKTLETIAAYYDSELEQATADALAKLEPAILCVLAVIAGFIVISMYMAMFSMYSSM